VLLATLSRVFYSSANIFSNTFKRAIFHPPASICALLLGATPILLKEPIEETPFGLRIVGDLFVEFVVIVNHLGKELFGDLVKGETGGLGWVDLATLVEGNVPRQFALKLSDGGRSVTVELNYTGLSAWNLAIKIIGTLAAFLIFGISY
jgi:hypothetical protein